jgi:hypothetical protein
MRRLEAKPKEVLLFKIGIREKKDVKKRKGIYAPMIYTAPCVMLLMWAASITRASGRGLGPGNREFFGSCEMASSR